MNAAQDSVDRSATQQADAYRVTDITLKTDGVDILKKVSLSFPRGKLVGVLGHNGSGKSSLIRIMARQLKPTAGTVSIFGRDAASFADREFARRVAYLPQDMGTGSDMTVRELVACGRYPWHGPLGRFSDEDKGKVQDAISATHLDAFAERLVGTLSGGERQRAWIAMLIAQDSQCLLLDEPTAALDIAHQVEVLSLVRRLCRDKGLSVIIVLHDINMAARFCDDLHALRNGEVVASGTATEVMEETVLKTIYGIDMGVLNQPGLGVPLAYVR